MSTSTIKAPKQTEKVTTLGTGITLWKYGKVRTLQLENVAAFSSLTLPADSKPSKQMNGLMRYRITGGNYHVALITISTAGAVTASYFIPNSTSAYGIGASSDGALIGSLTWIVD